MSGFGFRLNSKVDNRLREFHFFKLDRRLGVTKGIAGGGIFKTYRRSNIAAIANIKVFSVVCVHLEDTAHSFVLILGGVENGGTCLYNAGIYSEEAELADEWIRSNLECKRRKRLIVAGFTLNHFSGVNIGAFNGRDIQRRRHIIYDCIKELLYALVAVGSTAAYGNKGVVDGAFSYGGFKLRNGKLFTVKVLHHKLFIDFCRSFNKLLAIFFAKVLHIFRNISHFNIRAEIIKIEISFHLKKVNKTFKIGFGTDRKLNYERGSFKSGLDHVYDMEEVRAHNVHFVDINHARYFIFICLTPYGFRLGLYAAFCAKNGYGTVKNAERSFNLNSKVYMSGSIDNIDTVAVPICGGCGGSDSNTSFLFLNHPVHSGAAIVSFTDFVVNTGIVKYAFGCGSLSCVDVSHDTDISGHLK